MDYTDTPRVDQRDPQHPCRLRLVSRPDPSKQRNRKDIQHLSNLPSAPPIFPKTNWHMPTPMEEDDNVVVVVDGGGVVPSLVVTGDFPSWDWTDQASMLTSSATGSFSDDLSTTAAAATQAQAARIGNANASTTKTTTTTTATTPSATTTTTTTSSSSSSTIQVLVAGIPYSVPLSLVPRLSQLPWERNRSLPTLCPRLFEIVLHHLLFQALPNLSKLPDGDTEELETLALLLDLPDLEKHVTRGSGGGGGGRTNDGSRRGRGSRYCHPSRQAPPPLGEEEEGLPPSTSSSSSISTLSAPAVSSPSSSSRRHRRGSFFARRRRNVSDQRSWNGRHPSVSENQTSAAVAAAAPLKSAAAFGAPLRPRALQTRASSAGSETVLCRNTTTTTTTNLSATTKKTFRDDHGDSSLVGPGNGGYDNGDDDDELPIHRHPHYCLT